MWNWLRRNALVLAPVLTVLGFTLGFLVGRRWAFSLSEAVLGTIFGTVVGGTISLVVSSQHLRHQNALDEKTRQLAKFEMIYTTWSSISRRIKILTLEIVSKVVHGTPINVGSEVIPTENLKMLVDFYAPTLREQVDDVEARLEDLAKIFFQATMMDFQVHDKAAIVAEARRIDQATKEIDKLAEKKLAAYVTALRIGAA